MAIENKQNRKIQKEIKLKELADNAKWTRAKVALEFKDAVNLVQHMTASDNAYKIISQDWGDLSISFNWIYSWVWHIEPKSIPTITDTDKIAKQVQFILGTWLDLVDSTTDRVIILLRSAGMSDNQIVSIYTNDLHPETKYRQTVNRRYTKALDDLVYKLNHNKYLKWPSKIDRITQILSQSCDKE